MLFKVLDEPRGGLCPSRPFSFHLLIFTVLPVSLQGSGGDDFRRLHDPTGACLSFVLESEQAMQGRRWYAMSTRAQLNYRHRKSTRPHQLVGTVRALHAKQASGFRDGVRRRPFWSFRHSLLHVI